MNTISVFARTDRGARASNQDAFLVADLDAGRTGIGPDATHAIGRRGTLLAVSDGGGEAGEVASELAVTALHRILAVMPEDLEPAAQLRRAAFYTAKYLYGHFRRRDGLGRASATLTAVLVRDDAAYVAQIGDSRAYLVRGGRVEQITKDQTLAQALVDSGALDPAHPDATPPDMMLQSLGSDPAVRPVVTTVDVRAGDRLLVCSDGVSDAADAAALAAASDGDDLGAACRRVADLARGRGAGDNATVVLARVDGVARESPDDDAITWTFPEPIEA